MSGRAAPCAGDADRGARETVVRDVIRGLYEGRYEPGQRLYEAQLTRIHGISRGPVREALNKLAAMDIVELTLQRGARVKVLRVDEALDTLVVVRELIALAARLAALNIDRPGAREKMASVGRDLATFDPSSDGAEFALARDSFYAALTEIAGNTQLKAMLPVVRIHLIRVQFRAVLRATDATKHKDYRRIAQAVLSGRPGEAEAAVLAHFARAIEALRDFRGN